MGCRVCCVRWSSEELSGICWMKAVDLLQALLKAG